MFKIFVYIICYLLWLFPNIRTTHDGKNKENEIKECSKKRPAHRISKKDNQTGVHVTLTEVEKK